MKILLNLAPGLLGAYLVRLLITGASVGDSLVTIGLASLYAFFLFLESKKVTPVNKEYWDRLVELEERVKLHQDNFSAITIKSNIFGKK